MNSFARLFSRKNPFRLAEERVLVEQLRLLQENYSRAAPPILVLALLLLWTLSNDSNALTIQIWCAAAIFATLQLYSFHYLRAGITQAHRLVWKIMAMHALDGAIWGALAWITMESSTEEENILTFAAIAGMAGGAMSTLSPVLLVYLAYTLPTLGVVAIKVFLADDPAFNALGWTCILYFIALTSQAINTSRFARETIETTFALQENHRRLREIEQREMLAQERQRLMQDMHDGLGSSLVSALKVAERGQLEAPDIAQLLQDCINDLKLAIDSMEPVDADLLLLLATLRYRLEPRLKSSHIALRWAVNDVPALHWLTPRSSLHILRILQEAFTNIIKHTHATEIRFATEVDGDFAVVSIVDNGQGFAVERALNSGGKGLSNQLRRAESIGAKISWDSNGSGTCFTLRLPIAPASGKQ